jgi:hypothetical protein
MSEVRTTAGPAKAEQTACKDGNLEHEKVRWEIEELRLKVSDLAKPEYKRTTFWFSVAAAVVAVAGVIGQGYLSTIKSEQAELRVDKAKKDQESAEAKRDAAQTALTDLQKKVEEKKAELEQLRLVTDELTKLRENRDKEIADFDKKIAALKKEKEFKISHLHDIEQSLKSLQKTQIRVDDKAFEQSKLVKQLNARS